jgi:tetratricopeptide (TPR) repeat protein
MHDLRKGTELANRYTLVRKLGGDGAAQIWLASDRLTRADVGLKLIVDGRQTLAGLRKEWQTSIRLMHAHIVRVFEFNDDPEQPFYTLQFVDGPDIGILSGAPLEHVLPPLALVADALRYAHGKGVVHRDVKAGNILLDHNGAPYLIDFGVAAEGGTVAGGGSLIAASPQSLAGEPPQPADDIFALGGLIYELIAGRSAYSSERTAEDIRATVPDPLVHVDGTPVPAAIQQLVAEMLDKDASKRPTAAAVAAVLDDAGFAPAPAPKRYVAGARPAAAEIIEVNETSRARSRASAAMAAADGAEKRSGLSPRVVGIGLLVLVVLLIGVVFILPSAVTTDRSQPVVEVQQDTPQAGDQDRRTPAVGFTENVADLEGRDERVVARAETETVLGELLSKMDTLDKRAVQRWGGLRYKQAQSAYAEGDEAYLARNYGLAMEKYRLAIEIVEPLLDEVDQVFATTLANAQQALDAADVADALRLFELAVAISPSHAQAQAGYTRARNLDVVLALTEQGLAYEKNLELEASRQSFAQAIELDSEWLPAQTGLERVVATIRQMDFDQRMTEGLSALAEGDYPGARAAFRMAQQLKPESQEPADGLLQVDQGLRLDRIAALEAQAQSYEQTEEWQAAVETYAALLEIDADVLFAQQGLARAEQMTALHKRLDDYLADPDRLSVPATMRAATTLVVDITRMASIGPRLSDQRDELSRLLKRAATPLSVQLVSDNMTDVSIYKVGKLGSFATHELQLRPGTYVAVGSRQGYRDVRLEFRVGPEIESRPIVVRCEEAI